MTDTFTLIAEKKAELQKIMKEEGSTALSAAFKELFDSGVVLSIGWTQHTPYFNDGDTCEFGFDGLYVRFKGLAGEYDHGVDEDDEDYEPSRFYEDDGKSWSAWSIESNYGDYQARLDAAGIPKDLRSRIKQLDVTLHDNEELLLAVFGDHVRVAVGPDLVFHTDEYEHD